MKAANFNKYMVNSKISSDPSTAVATVASDLIAGQDGKKPELIFNFMGMVWGTNDPNSKGQDWMSK